MEELRNSKDEPWNPAATGIALNQLGALTLYQGDLDGAEVWFGQSLALHRDLDLQFAHGNHAAMGIADIARARGDNARAAEGYRTALQSAVNAHDARGIAYLLGAVAGNLAAMHRFEPAARLFGASEAHHERIVYPFDSTTFERQRAFGLPEPWAGAGLTHGIAEPLYLALKARTVPIRSIVLEADCMRSWWAEGRLLTLDEAVALALAAPEDSPATTEPLAGLSPREIEVLRLLAEGESNRAIAETLFLSKRTVERHVLHILAKLECESRTAAATWAVRHGLA